jgi:intracellular sulfur oxidation DsrE/DsrF family protein
MKNQNQYSDEHINAYIDSELDNDERTRLLFDEQQDTTLAQRINDARILKEKVQLAYSNLSETGTTKKTFSCTAFVSKQKSLVAGLIILLTVTALLLPTITNNEDVILARQLIKNTHPITPGAIAETIGKHKQIVINISQYQPQNFDATIANIEALLLQHSADKSFNIEIVANKNGLKALDTKTSLHAERISQLAKQFNSLNVVACAKGMADLAAAGDPIQLIKSIMITPSAAQQVAKRMSEGWMYLKL